MRDNRYSRGGGSGRGGRGGRHGGGGGRHSRGGSRGGMRGGGRGGRGGGRHHHSRMRPRSAESGNSRERVAIESGHLVLIDQFMLANPQFTAKIIELIDAEPELKNKIIEEYGGTVVELAPATYRIIRDPYSYLIVVFGDDWRPDLKTITERATDSLGRVFIDTRCLAMIDRELLDDSALLEKYQQLWFSGQDKACRDLLRDNGGAVRYGFQRFGDELGVYAVPGEDVVALWPDVAEPMVTDDKDVESAAM